MFVGQVTSLNEEKTLVNMRTHEIRNSKVFTSKHYVFLIEILVKPRITYFTSMTTEDLIINDGCYREAVKAVSKSLP